MTSLSQRTGTTWAIAQFMCSVAVVSSLLFGSGCSANHLFSEGGSFPVQDDDSPQVQDFTTFGQKVYTDDEFQRPNQQYKTEFSSPMEQMFVEQQRRRLSNIIAQLRENGQSSPQELADGPGVFVEEQDLGVPIERPPDMGTYWDELKEKMLKNWSKIKKRIELLLLKGRELREILNNKCKKDKKLWEKLWEASVEETNELRQLVDQKPSIQWKKQLLEEYSLYRQFCWVVEKTLKTLGTKSKTAKSLYELLVDGAGGESNETSKKHKRIWLGMISDALAGYEQTEDEIKGVFEKQSGGEQESSEMIGENDGREIAAVKKGQNEFVEFVEPQPHQNNRHKEWMDKRVPTNSDRKANAFKFLTNSGNLLFMAYLAVCCFGIVAGTVGGVYYYNHVRASRIDDPFNEFTRYSPAGPGKDKLKKSGSPVFGQSGDDTLAYKAQLHHYQQQKQKILGSASGPVVENVSDNEEDTEEMDHNYSVFECPGLAPTGDLEIQNPNFVGADKSGTNETRRAE